MTDLYVVSVEKRVCSLIVVDFPYHFKTNRSPSDDNFNFMKETFGYARGREHEDGDPPGGQVYYTSEKWAYYACENEYVFFKTEDDAMLARMML